MFLSKKEEKIAEEEKDKKKRIRLTSEKTTYLQRYFEMKPRPTTNEKREISKALSMNFRSVQVWFQNRRAKYKKDVQDMTSNLTPQVIGRSLASNNSMFMRKDVLEGRPFYEIYPYHCRNDGRYNIYSNEQQYTSFMNNINSNEFSTTGGLLNDFYENGNFRPKKWFKFHDCSDDKSFKKENVKMNWNDNFVNNEIFEEDEAGDEIFVSSD